MRAGRIIMAIIGGLLTTVGMGLLVAGAAIVGIHATQRDPGGFYQTPAARFQTLTPALVAHANFEGTDRAGWPDSPLGTIRITARSETGTPLFVGIAPATDVDRWLAGATYARVTGPGASGQELVSGDRSIGPPTAETFGVATATGAGDQTLTWASQPGDWAIVVMNADASAVVAADMSIGSDTALLLPLGILVGVLGLGVVGAGAVFLAVAVGRSADDLPAPAGRPGAYPVRLTGRLEPGLSRWQWLVKWFLAIPHFVILALLWLAVLPLTFFAGLAILVTGRYPRAIFEFNVGVMRWTWRVSFYTLGALATDRYPPFALERDPTYPADLEVDYPQRLSRGLVLVKWWLLALPHYVIVALLLGSITGGDYSWSLGWSGGIIALLVLAAGIVLLLTGSYPTVLFDLVMGLNRWCYRVFAYAGLMRDEYPPFRLDNGGPDPPAACRSRSHPRQRPEAASSSEPRRAPIRLADLVDRRPGRKSPGRRSCASARAPTLPRSVDVVEENVMRTWQVGDVMSTDVASVDSTATYRQIVALIEERRVNAVPVIDSFRRVLGVVTESDLLRKVEHPQPGHGLILRPDRRAALAKSRGEIARELMTAPAIVTYAATSIVNAARDMARARVKQLPVIDDLGRLVGIVSRGDLLRVHLRPDADIYRDIVNEVVHRPSGMPDGRVIVQVTDGIVRLTGHLNRRSSADLAEAMASRVSGVVSVTNDLRFNVDDTFLSELTS